MSIPILIIIAIIILLALGGGTAFWLVLKRRQPTKETATVKAIPFSWSYILLPLVILLLSVILTAYFYRLLPAEVAYHFAPDGSPDRWLSREVITVWFLIPQSILTLAATAIIWGIIRLSTKFQQPEGTGINPKGILLLMGNMIALPQIILGFAMLDIFSYNSYQIHLLPLWVFTLIIMVVGGIILGIFFIRVMWRSWGAIR